jgi:hypothetical protein
MLKTNEVLQTFEAIGGHNHTHMGNELQYGGKHIEKHVETRESTTDIPFGTVELSNFVHFRHPFTMVVSGSTGSGKTEFIKKLIAYRDTLIDPMVDKVIYVYGEYQQAFVELENDPNVFFTNECPDEDKLREWSQKYGRIMLILDDMMLNVKKAAINALFTKSSHHIGQGISLVFVVQNLYFEGIRTARINSHYLVLMRNKADALQIQTIGRQLFPGKSATMIDAYADATKMRYGYLVVDNHPANDNEITRLRTNIFPGQRMEFYK